MKDNLCYGRPVAAAERLGDAALDRHRFIDKHVLLTGERAVLQTNNGRHSLLSSVLLLPRICRNVSFFLPMGCNNLVNECKSTADRVGFSRAVEYLDKEPGFEQYDAILSIGTATRPDLPWTVVNSNGWLARISSVDTDLPPDCNEYNPMAALAAACLGVTEVFKRLLKVKESRGRLVDGLIFSLYSYQSQERDVGPPLLDNMALELLLVGIGAIGNGVVHLLNLLPVTGRVWMVDSQTFQPENLGTCMLIGPSNIGRKKALFGESVLGSKLKARGFHEDFMSFRDRIGKEIPYQSLVLNGVDNISARHAVQSLWPDMIIDGAIGDFGCQVSRHPWGEDVACLRCLFQEPGQSAERIASEATGLSFSRTQEAFEVVTDDDVQAAPTYKRGWLRAHIGQKICSVVQEAVAKQITEEQQNEGFEPSVPFAAALSASMMVGELVKYICGFWTPLEPRFQFDVLRGPAFGQEIPQERRSDCICVTRKKNIDTVRVNRAREWTLKDKMYLRLQEDSETAIF
jgi:molybdopterin/thiamine biosynthesis adenylyltransferase